MSTIEPDPSPKTAPPYTAVAKLTKISTYNDVVENTTKCVYTYQNLSQYHFQFLVSGRQLEPDL